MMIMIVGVRENGKGNAFTIESSAGEWLFHLASLI